MEIPDIFVSTDGVKMVIITLAEYERLRKCHSASKRTRMPSVSVRRIEAGASKLRVWREYRELSLTELAQRAQLTTACVAQIESGARTGTISTLKRLAEALDATIDDLV